MGHKHNHHQHHQGCCHEKHEHESCCSHESHEAHGCSSHHEDSCCSNHKPHQSSCGSDCKCSCHTHQGCDDSCHEDFGHFLLELADEAWTELLKEKIKQKIGSVNDVQLDQLAQVVSEKNNERWKHKIAAMRLQREFKKQIHDIF